MTAFIILCFVIHEFLLYGPTDPDASIQLVYGPTVMDMTVKKAFLICSGILLFIGMFYSMLTMLLSQVFKSSTVPVAALAVLLICSMLNPPVSYRLLSQVLSYLSATFPGSWTFTDYRLLNVFGMRLNILQVMPKLYLILTALLGAATYVSYAETQIKGG